MLPAQGLRDPTPHLHITPSDESQPPRTVELSNLARCLAAAQRCLLKLLFDEEEVLACGGQRDTKELASFPYLRCWPAFLSAYLNIAHPLQGISFQSQPLP